MIAALVLFKRTQGGLSIIPGYCKGCVLEACRERLVRPVLPFKQMNAVSVISCLLTRPIKQVKKGLSDEEMGEQG